MESKINIVSHDGGDNVDIWTSHAKGASFVAHNGGDATISGIFSFYSIIFFASSWQIADFNLVLTGDGPVALVHFF